MKYRFDAILIDFYGTICAGDREAVDCTDDRFVERVHRANDVEFWVGGVRSGPTAHLFQVEAG